jgi:hypothetical protein
VGRRRVSVEAILWALNLTPVPAGRGGQPSSACKFVLVGLANHAGPEGTGAFPSVAGRPVSPSPLWAAAGAHPQPSGSSSPRPSRPPWNRAGRRVPSRRSPEGTPASCTARMPSWPPGSRPRNCPRRRRDRRGRLGAASVTRPPGCSASTATRRAPARAANRSVRAAGSPGPDPRCLHPHHPRQASIGARADRWRGAQPEHRKGRRAATCGQDPVNAGR